jgi:cell division protease FtsH
VLFRSGASRVRSLFADARKSSPSIVFIDELDSIGRHRGAGLGGGHDEREQTLNQLLSAMDGFEPHEGVIVMAATNRPDILDPALLRPGRFDRRVVVEQGGLQARLEILRIHARNKPLADDVDLEDLARGTPGFSGADLENLLNEAALVAARGTGDVIAREDLDLARDKILLGLKREGMDLDEEEWRLIAYHEAGHALVAAMLPRADRIQKVSIVPRGRAMGVTQQLPERDRYIQRREELVDRLTVLLGGRAAERIVFDTTTSGAENDLKVAADLSRRMVTDWGMGEGLENLALGGSREHVFLGEEIAERRPYGEETARIVDQAVHGLVTDAARQATGLLEENRRALDRVANELLVHEELTGTRVDELISVSPGRAGHGESS